MFDFNELNLRVFEFITIKTQIKNLNLMTFSKFGELKLPWAN
jgi:hypothetical protein